MAQQVALSNIQGVRVCCRRCSVAVTYPLAELENVGYSGCSQCDTTGRGPAVHRTTAADRLRQLGAILRRLVNDEAAEVSLEVVMPLSKV